ncbi:MAG: T9SS type A sorting domain-containing protein [Candidatus Cloacimonetes bacterium]|jgi:flagellar hook assembly protein FlgD|nr:T9SS type A sorting domain-containing protein [Candidatus Cloacimonadota bacterium]
MGAGKHSLNWDGTDSNGAQLASGVYIYRLSTGKTSASRKMILLK